MKKLLVILLILSISVGLFAVKYPDAKAPTSTFELSPTAVINGSTVQNREMWDILYTFNASAVSMPGTETDGVNIYTTTWNAGTFSRYEIDGTHLGDFTLGGVSNIRDMAYDGTYFYGSPADMTIYIMDLANEALIGTIPVSCSGVTGVRHIAYDPGLDGGNGGFWVGNWAEFGAIAMDGSEIYGNIAGISESTYGTAYDEWTDGGPYIWNFKQIGNGAELHQFDIASQTLTGVVHDASDLPGFIAGSIAGGLATYVNDDGLFVMLANIQQETNLIGIYEIAITADPAAPGAPTGVILTPDAGGALQALIDWTCPTLQVNGDPLSDLDEMRVYRDGTLIYTDTNPTIGGAGSYNDVVVPSAGNYSYSVVGYNDLGEGIPASVTAWIGEDIPDAVSDIVLTDVSTGDLIAQLDWVNPTSGYHGGYFTGVLGHDIERSDGAAFVHTGSTTTWQDDSIVNPGVYSYTITPFNSTGSGPSATSAQVGIGVSIIQIGAGEVTDYQIPINLFYMDSMVEVIYLQEWLGTGMVINTVSFHAATTSTLTDAYNLEIWMGETAEDDLSAGWIDGTNMIQVFSGTHDVPSGDSWIDIALDEDFVYEYNDNLLIMIIRDDDEYYSTTDLWWCTESSTPFRTRYDYTDNSTGSEFNALTGPWDGTYEKTIYPDVRFYYSSLADPEAPGEATDVTFVADAGGALEAEISWTSPTLNYGGTTLTELLEMRVYRDEVLIYTDTNPAIGGTGSYLDISVPSSDYYEYSVVGYNTFGIGIPVDGVIWVGEDVPNIVENLLLGEQAGAGYLTWDNPTTGFHGGPFNEPILGYHIERNDGAAFEITGITTEYLDDTIAGADYYSYTVTPYNSIGDGPPAITNLVMLGAGTVIFSDDFEAGLGNWEVINNGGVGLWMIYSEPFPNAYTLPSTSTGNICCADSDEAGSSTTTDTALELLTALDLSNYNSVNIQFDNDFYAIDTEDYCYVDISSDGGSTWDNVLEFAGVSVRETHEIIDITDLAAGQSNVLVRFHSVQPGWDWWWAIDNVGIYGVGGGFLAPPENVQVDDYLGLVTWEEPVSSRSEKSTKENSRDLTGYNVYLNDVFQGYTTDLEFLLTGLIYGDNYTAGVKAVYDEGVSAMVEVDFTYTGVSAGNDIPLVTKLSGNYPNPFNPTTTISFSLKEAGHVSINIYNMRGQLVKTLVNDELENDYHEIVWDSKDNSGKNAASGVYFYKMKAQNYNSTKKMILMK